MRGSYEKKQWVGRSDISFLIFFGTTKGRYFFRSTARLYSVHRMNQIPLKGFCVHSRYSPRHLFQDLQKRKFVVVFSVDHTSFIGDYKREVVRSVEQYQYNSINIDTIHRSKKSATFDLTSTCDSCHADFFVDRHTHFLIVILTFWPSACKLQTENLCFNRLTQGASV